MKTIVQTAIDSGNFKTLVEAVKAADLVETLSGEGPFTVFAPTDEAFAKIPAETLQAVLKDKEKLTKILTYHVAGGVIMAEDIKNMPSAMTLEGQDVTFDTSRGVKVDNATVVMADIACSNGVIHAIDTVLMPK